MCYEVTGPLNAVPGNPLTWLERFWEIHNEKAKSVWHSQIDKNSQNYKSLSGFPRPWVF